MIKNPAFNEKFTLKFRTLLVIMSLLSAFLLSSGCGDDPTIEKPPVVEKDTLIVKGQGSTTPYFTGTFIDFWNKEIWTDNQWTAHLNEMKEIGIKTLFVQFTAYNDYLWTDSNSDYSSSIYKDVLYNLLNAANKADMNVFVGLYFNENYWNNTTNSSELNLQAQRSIDLADDIWLRLKNNKSFAGWYISQEGAPYYYGTEEKFNLLKNKLINPIATHCKMISDKPVSTTVFFNNTITTVNKFKTFMKRMATCDLDLIMIQDGIGVGHCGFDDLDKYFEVANEGLFAEGGFKGALWADVETFTTNNTPESFDNLKEKLTILSPYVRNMVIFQYYNDMSPSGPGGLQAKELRDAYLNYLP